MTDTLKQTTQIIRTVKNERTDEERLQGWQETCLAKGLSGEFAIASQIGEQAVTEEQIKMVSELFGR
ncbi:hypothetical protein [Neisseria chenwenguii]|uniref:Uncharacterized protein n=1 Tax=Neisseria chenwenguii TaxID=1853278 RepID=A0A220S346_9NEIS|nr:hypothetical protein [Neisseria chenwenguii]ASK27919.1 hypothetical protein BG910_09415 [Neisseria chenwenguii]ROV56223.1 hypothetical protein EGS38_05730 [Neisseria chenwenguii]